MKVTNETRALAHEILAYWLRFNKHDQNQWVGQGASVSTTKIGNKKVNVCNTTMCAAGTAVFLNTTPTAFLGIVNDWTFSDWMNEGGELLGLDSEEASLVFLSSNKSVKKYMKAIAAGSQKKFDKARLTRTSIDDEEDEEDY